MKRNVILVLLFLLFTFSLGFAATITIGTGTTTGRYPLGDYFIYQRSQMLYTSSEIGLGGNITHLRWYRNDIGADPDAVDIEIWLKETSDTAISGTEWESPGTLVFSSSAIDLGSGDEWYEIDITDFMYGGTDNLLVSTYCQNAPYTSPHSLWRYTSTSPDIMMRGGQSDSTNPPTISTLTSRPNIQFEMETSAPDSPASIVALAASVSEIDLDWAQNAAGNNVMVAWNLDGNFGIPVNGVTYGSDDAIPGGGTVLYYGSGVHFDHQSLDPTTQYFYKAWSYDGSEYSPGIIADAITLSPPLSLPWSDDFTGSQEDWTIINENGDGDTWNPDYGFNYNSPSEVARIYTDYNSGANDDYLITPGLTLAGADRLSFWQRVQSSSEPNDFEVLLSETGNAPADFTEVLLANAEYSNTSYEEIVIDLTGYSGTCYIAFHVPNGGLDGYYLYIDDVSVTPPPVFPAISVQETYENSVIIGESLSDAIPVENDGGGPLNVTNIIAEEYIPGNSHIYAIDDISNSSGYSSSDFVTVAESFDVVNVIVELTWSITDGYPGEGSATLTSPSGTNIQVISSYTSDGTYSIILDDFAGENVNGDWLLTVNDSFGDGGQVVTDISLEIPELGVWQACSWLTLDQTQMVVPMGDIADLGFNINADNVAGISQGRINITSDAEGVSGTENVIDLTLNWTTPIAPIVLNVDAEDGYVELDWTDPVRPDQNREFLGYNIYRKLSDEAFGAPITSTFQTTYTDNDVVNAVTYTYGVARSYSAGESDITIASNVAIPLAASAVPYYETFEDNNGHFYGTEEWVWTDLSGRDPLTAPSGTHVWGTSPEGYFTTNIDHWLYSAPYDLSNSNDLLMTLSYWLNVSTYSGVAQVYADWDNSGNWELVHDLTANNSSWTQESFSVQPPANRSNDYVRFAFYMYSYNGTYSGLFIDDVKIHEPSPTAVVSSNFLDFGEYQVGQTGTEVITISNPANAPVDLEIYSINSSSPYFSMDAVSRTDYIAPGASMNYQVSFAPAEITEYEEYFTIVSNDPFTLPPFGNGVQLNVVGTGVEPFSILGSLPNRVDLFVASGGNVDVRFDLTNEGVLPLDVYDITMVTRDLAVDPGSFTGIGQNETEEVTVSFNSGSVNNLQTGAINFTTNEPPNPPGENFEVWPPVNFDITGGSDEFTQYNSSGNNSAKANFWGSMASGDDAYLTSVANDISTFASPTLQFNWSHIYNSFYPGDALTVRISADGTTWEDVWYKAGVDLESADGASSTTPGSFALASIEIPASYLGGSLYVQFYAYSGWGPDLFLDNINLVDGARSLSEGSPQSYSIPVAAYTLEGYDELDATTGYHVVNSIAPEAIRTTDIPSYEWFDNVSEANLWDWIENPTYELPETMDFMGQEINNIGLDSYYSYVSYSTIVTPTIVMIPDVEEEAREEESREISMPTKLPWISNRNSEDNDTRNILTENCISAAGNLEMAGGEYVSSEEFGTVVTWNYPDAFVAQVIMYKSGEIKINYKELISDFPFFTSNDPDVGIMGLTDEVRYSNPAWVFSNLMPEMSIKFSPEFDDTQMLPTELTMIEDEVYLLDVSAYITTGGEVLDIVMTDSENITTVLDGNVIELHTALNFNTEVGETISYVISGATRSTGDILVTVEAVNDLPVVITPVEDVILAEDFGTYSVPINNVFEDVDSEIEITVTLSDDTKVDVEIDGDNLVFSSIQDMFTDVPLEVTLVATELDRSIQLTSSKVTKLTSSRTINTDRERAEVETMFLLTITPVNDVPVVQNAVADFAIAEDGSAMLDLLNIFYDPDGDDLTLGFDQVVDPHLNLLLEGSILTITPEANWNGEEAVVITCDDGVETLLVSSRRVSMDASRDVATDDFMVTVTAVNDAPVVANPIADFSFDEDTVDTSIDLNMVFDDYDAVYGDIIGFTVSGANNIAVDVTDGFVTLTPALNWNGIEVLTFKATDSHGAFVNEAVQIVVDPVNDIPTIALPEMISFNEGTMLTRNFGQFINDVDGDELMLTVAGNSDVVVSITGLTVVFSSADPIYYGSETLTFTVDDGSTEARATASDDIEIVVNYVNEAPVYVGPTYIGMPDIYEDFSDENGAYTIGTLTDLFTDQEIAAGYDWTNFTFEIVSFNTAKIDAYIEDGDLKITSVPNAFGLSTLRVKANDNDAYTASRAARSFTQNIEIYLESVNDLPYFMDLQTDIAMAANSIQYIYFDANVMDVDDPTPELTITAPEGFVTITKLAGYNYRFKFDALGLFDLQETVTLTLDDGNGGIAEAQIAVSIAASEPPYTTYLIPIQEFDEDFESTEIIDLTTCFADPDDAVLNYSVTVNTFVGGVPVINAMIDADNVLWIGSSIENWYGEAEVAVNCWDNLDRYTITQNVGVVVNPVNDLPTVAGEIADQDLQEDFAGFQVADLSTIFNDVDGDFLFYQVTVSETDVVLPVINGTMLDLNPLMDMFGTTTVTVGVRDNSLPYNWIEIEFMVNVNDVMDYPTFMGGIDGGLFEFNIAGEILDLTAFVDTHNQVNTVPLSYVFTPLPGIPEPCYEITQNPYPLYGFTVTPVGYQPENWHVTYPDQECTLILEGGDQIVVTFTTNLSPYVVMPIEDVVLIGAGRAGTDMDNYFADPMDYELSYDVIYETDVLDISMDGSVLYFNDIVNSAITNVTIVASNTENRSTCAQTFQVVAMNGTNFELLVVDQDHSSVFNYDDVAAKVTAALDELGINYTTFEYEGEDNGPSAETLALYNMVLWFTGDACEAYETLSETDMTNIAAFIDNGGWFYLNSQDMIFDVYTQRDEMEGERVQEQEIFIPEGDFAYDYLGLREVYQDYWEVNFRTIGAEGTFLEGFYADLSTNHPVREQRYANVRNEIYTDLLSNHVGTDLMVAELNLERTLGTNSIMYGNTTFSTVPFLGYSNKKLEEYFAYIFAYYNGMYIPATRTASVEPNEAPAVTALKGNYPNPFNPTTNIMFALSEETNVAVEIFNLKGQKVRTLVNTTMVAGDHSVVWDGANDKGDACGSGVYFYKLRAASRTDVKKMLMLK